MLNYQELAKRQLALRGARLPPGGRFWVAKQRWLWQQKRLPSEQVHPPPSVCSEAAVTSNVLQSTDLQTANTGYCDSWEVP